MFLFGDPGDEFISKFVQVVDKIEFLVVVGLRSLLPCWLVGHGLISDSRGHLHSLAYDLHLHL